VTGVPAGPVQPAPPGSPAGPVKPALLGRRTEGCIGPDLVVHGTLSGKSDLRIDGILEGELRVEGLVVVGPDGSVIAPISVGSLTVEGEVRGDVVAAGSVAIRPGGRLLGDVRARRICIDDGASLQGGIEMEFEADEGER
jgi:cytoskeletal protein CcmA (bactofilin family)